MIETMKIIPHKFLHLLSYFHVRKVSILRNQDIIYRKLAFGWLIRSDLKKKSLKMYKLNN